MACAATGSPPRVKFWMMSSGFRFFAIGKAFQRFPFPPAW